MGKLEEMMKGAGANVGESMGAARVGGAVHRATPPAFAGVPARPLLVGADLPGEPLDLAVDGTYLWVGTTAGLVRFRLEAVR